MATGAMKADSNVCPDPETMAAFLDGRLSEHDREHVAAHLAGCERCYFVFTEAVQGNVAQPTPAGDTRWWTRRRVVWSSAATLAAAAALVLAVRVGIGPRSQDQQLQTLITAVGTERVIEPRLSGGFAYGPRRTVRSTPTALSLSPDLRIAAARVEKATESNESPEALRARGVACLLIGNVECAIPTLERAATGRPTDASILNDLAAAYLVRGERVSQNDVADLVRAERMGDQNDASRALAMSNRALEIDRLLPEARFNRAAALERLGMRSEAREAWQAYLTIDDRSGWADEARTRLQALTREP